MSEFSEKMRAMCTAADTARDAGLTTPDDVARFDDIAYGPDPDEVLDLYRPKEAGDRELPVIISFHGGGWIYGNKDVYQYYCMSLAEQGFAVVNFTYRLSPEHKFPAPLVDMNLVMKWVKEQKESCHLDTDHVFGVGDSAGGNGLALYSEILSNPAYAKDFGPIVSGLSKEELAELNSDPDYVSVDAGGFYPIPGMALTAVALNCGAYRLTEKDETMKEYLPHGPQDAAEMRMVNVENFITKDFPPAFVMTCPKDFLIEQPKALLPKLQEAGVDYVYRFYTNAARDLAHVFHCNMKSPDARRVNREECEFFRHYI